MKRLSSLFAVVVLLAGVLMLGGSPPHAAAQEGGEPTPVVEEPVHGEAPGITEGEGPSSTAEEDIQPIQFALRLTGMGMGVVFTALLILSGLLIIAQRTYNPPAKEPTSGGAVAPAPAEITTARDGLSPEVMAAISAAVAIATQKRFRIKRIRYRESPPLDAWSRQGRITIMTSRRGKSQNR